jgi:hypothetical protein
VLRAWTTSAQERRHTHDRIGYVQSVVIRGLLVLERLSFSGSFDNLCALE